MLIVGGVNFFPSQLEGVVLGFEEIQPQYDVHLSRYRGRDRVVVHVETTSEFWSKAGEEGLDDLAKRMEKKIKDWIGFRIEVHLVEPFTLPRSEGKAHRVHDQR